MGEAQGPRLTRRSITCVRESVYLPPPLSDVTDRNAVPERTEPDVAGQDAVPDASELHHGLMEHLMAYTTAKKLQSGLAK